MTILLIYDIVMLSVIFMSLYLLFIILVFIKAEVDYRKRAHKHRELQTVKKMLRQIKKRALLKEEHRLSVYENNLTLTDLVTKEPKEGDYEDVLDLLTILCYNTYKEYKFLIHRSSNEEKQGNFLSVVNGYEESPDLHKAIFAKCMDAGIDMEVLQEKFAKKVAKGDVINLGKGVTVLTDDGTDLAPTGVSPVNSGLEDSQIVFNITFVQTENYEAFKENNLDK